MKAVRLVKIGEPLEMQDIPIPEVGSTDIVVQVKAAGICHSDVHYRAGLSPTGDLPLTLGHEVAGIVDRIGDRVSHVKVGDRVALHYLVICGDCYYCASGNEQFCSCAEMLGHHRDGGYAEYIKVPAHNAVLLPESIPFDQGATLMCASATAYHALRKARIKPADQVAIFGVGGLGQSAVQLARGFGATTVYAIDINADKLELAATHGAIPINGKAENVVERLQKETNGRGVDAAIELIGLQQTQKQALQSVGPLGRVVLVGLSKEELPVDVYNEILGGEVELIGSNDHHLTELYELMDFVKSSRLDISEVVSKKIPLDADAINVALDALEKFGSGVRTVIEPQRVV